MLNCMRFRVEFFRCKNNNQRFIGASRKQKHEVSNLPTCSMKIKFTFDTGYSKNTNIVTCNVLALFRNLSDYFCNLFENCIHGTLIKQFSSNYSMKSAKMIRLSPIKKNHILVTTVCGSSTESINATLCQTGL